MPLPSFPTKQVVGDRPNWLELPNEITINILKRLSTFDIVTSVCQVCPLWWNICKDPFMWRTIHMTEFYIMPKNDSLKICRSAIKRSCGHLEDIDIQYFGNDDLLKFIADNGSHLRRLRLVDCNEISDKGLTKAVKQLPLLEELDIDFSNLRKDSLEVIGLSCPLLKSLKFRFGYESYFMEKEWYDEAFSFIKTMPELRHLEIYYGVLTNDGLLAILNGCPRLESLHINDCDNLDFSSNVWKRCCEQIKHLVLPYNYKNEFLCHTDNYFDNLSENSNDHSIFSYGDDYELADSEYDAIVDYSDYSDDYP